MLVLPARSAFRHATHSSAFGALPVLSMTTAFGVLGVAIADSGARQSQGWSEALFWASLIWIIVPISARLVGRSARGTERLGLVVLMGTALFLASVVYSPLVPSAYDAFLHIRTADDIVARSGLFTPNPLLPVSPFYPGLEAITVALHQLGGVSLLNAGFLILGSARIVFTVSLFFFFQYVSGSSRVAGIAALFYMANPRFLYFDSQYAYESLALALAALVLCLVAWRGRRRIGGRAFLGLMALGIIGTVTTHHVTSLMLGALLLMWAVLDVARHRKRRQYGPRIPALITVGAIACWILFVASPTVAYLVGPVTHAAAQISAFLETGSGKALFAPSGAEVTPLWERAVGFGSVAVILLTLSAGIPATWRRYGWDPAPLALTATALLFPVTLVARLTPTGSEVASRTPEFLFVGIGLVVGVLIAYPATWLAPILRPLVVVPLLVVVFVGGIILGLPRWQRLPGPYLVSADFRSVEPNGIAAAAWARQALGPGHRFVADRVNRILMSTYGRQTSIGAYIATDVDAFYETPAFGPNERSLIRQTGAELVVVDRRLTTALPTVGFYFKRGELAGPRTEPLAPEGLDKLDGAPNVSRLFDNGSIQIYDVRAIH